LFVTTEKDIGNQLSSTGMQLEYFHGILEPVPTWLLPAFLSAKVSFCYKFKYLPNSVFNA